VVKVLVNELLCVCEMLSNSDFMPQLQTPVSLGSFQEVVDPCEEAQFVYRVLVPLEPPPGHCFHLQLGTEGEMPLRNSHLCVVLDLARTGLIFTRSQKGAQPVGLTKSQPGQTELGIPYHVPSCWVPVGGAARRELTRGSGACYVGLVWENGSVGCAVYSVYSPYLYHCCCFPLF